MEQIYAFLDSKILFLGFEKLERHFFVDKYNEIAPIFQKDYNRYFKGEVDVKDLLITPPLIGILTYRLAREFYLKGDNYFANVFSVVGRFLSQMELYYSADIGSGLKINHGIGLIVGARVQIGDNCLLHQNVTFGDKGGGRPAIGDNVVVYANSLILGEITIGNNSVVGANSLVINSFDDNSVIAGSPAKKILL